MQILPAYEMSFEPLHANQQRVSKSIRQQDDQPYLPHIFEMQAFQQHHAKTEDNRQDCRRQHIMLDALQETRVTLRPRRRAPDQGPRSSPMATRPFPSHPADNATARDREVPDRDEHGLSGTAASPVVFVDAVCNTVCALRTPANMRLLRRKQRWAKCSAAPSHERRLTGPSCFRGHRGSR